jgi:hypothetical protein
MFNKLGKKALSLYVKGRSTVSRARERYRLACQRVRSGAAFEEGQGFTEYIIIIAGVLLIGSAIFVVFRTIRTKYESANSAIGGLPVEGSW